MALIKTSGILSTKMLVVFILFWSLLALIALKNTASAAIADFCYTSSAEGYIDYSSAPVVNTTSTGNFSAPLPGHGNVTVTYDIESNSGFDKLRKEPSLSYLHPDSPIYNAQGYSGTSSREPLYIEKSTTYPQTIIYTFDEPAADFDLIILDIDSQDELTISATDLNGAPLAMTNFALTAEGDATTAFAPNATPPNWNPLTGVLSSAIAGNENRSFTVLSPTQLVKSITLAFLSPTSGGHFYADMYGTQDPSLRCGSISGIAFIDSNDNGLLDTSDTKVSNNRVELYNYDTQSLITSTQTDNSGFYSFTNLSPGTYYAKIYQPENVIGLISFGQGSNGSSSWFDQASYQTGIINVSGASPNPDNGIIIVSALNITNVNAGFTVTQTQTSLADTGSTQNIFIVLSILFFISATGIIAFKIT